MREKEKNEQIFEEYPDVVNVNTLCEMLGGIGLKSAYKLVNENKIGHFKIGRKIYIPKFKIIQYLMIECNI